MIQLETSFQYAKEKPTKVSVQVNSVHMAAEAIRQTLVNIFSSPTKPVRVQFAVILPDDLAKAYRPKEKGNISPSIKSSYERM